MTAYLVGELLKDEVLDSRNTKRTNNLHVWLESMHMWEVRIGALQDQPGVHEIGISHGMDSSHGTGFYTFVNVAWLRSIAAQFGSNHPNSLVLSRDPPWQVGPISLRCRFPSLLAIAAFITSRPFSQWCEYQLHDTVSYVMVWFWSFLLWTSEITMTWSWRKRS